MKDYLRLGIKLTFHSANISLFSLYYLLSIWRDVRVQRGIRSVAPQNENHIGENGSV